MPEIQKTLDRLTTIKENLAKIKDQAFSKKASSLVYFLLQITPIDFEYTDLSTEDKEKHTGKIREFENHFLKKKNKPDNNNSSLETEFLQFFEAKISSKNLKEVNEKIIEKLDNNSKKIPQEIKLENIYPIKQRRIDIIEWILKNTGGVKQSDNESIWHYSENPLQTINYATLLDTLYSKNNHDNTQHNNHYFLVFKNILLLIDQYKSEYQKKANIGAEDTLSSLQSSSKKSNSQKQNLGNSKTQDFIKSSQLSSHKDETEIKTEDTSHLSSKNTITIGENPPVIMKEAEKPFSEKKESSSLPIETYNSHTEISDITQELQSNITNFRIGIRDLNQRLRSNITKTNDKHKILVTSIDGASHSLQKGIHELNQMDEKTQLLIKQFQENIDQSEKITITDHLEKKIDLSRVDTKEDDDFTKLLASRYSGVFKKLCQR